MAIVRGVIRRVLLSHEPGAWVDLRLLSWRQLEEAQHAHLAATVRQFSGLADGMEAFQGFIDKATVGGTVAQQQNFDTATLLRAGIVAWSYEEPVSPENIDDLDAETVRVLVAELTPHGQSEEERKNGFERSTEPLTEGEPLPTAG